MDKNNEVWTNPSTISNSSIGNNSEIIEAIRKISEEIGKTNDILDQIKNKYRAETEEIINNAKKEVETPIVQETIEETPAINEVSNEESTIEPELNPVLENTVQLPEVSVDATVETNTPVEVDTPIVTETPIEESKEENTNSESFIDIADILNGEASIPTEETKIDIPVVEEPLPVEPVNVPEPVIIDEPTTIQGGNDSLPVEPTNVVLPDAIDTVKPPVISVTPTPAPVPEPTIPTNVPEPATPTLPDIPTWDLEPIPLDTIPASVKTMDGKQRSLMLDNNEKLIEKKDESNPAVMTLKQ